MNTPNVFSMLGTPQMSLYTLFRLELSKDELDTLMQGKAFTSKILLLPSFLEAVCDLDEEYLGTILDIEFGEDALESFGDKTIFLDEVYELPKNEYRALFIRTFKEIWNEFTWRRFWQLPISLNTRR